MPQEEYDMQLASRIQCPGEGLSADDMKGQIMPVQYPQVTISNTETRLIPSSNVDQEFRILVALPDSYADTDRAYPVVYVLDAAFTFGTAAEAARLLSLHKEIPEVLVVGIGYAANSMMETAAVRTRDYTPTVNDDWYNQVVANAFPGAPEYVGSGGAADFIRFIREELMPFMCSNYRIEPEDQTIIGHSFGGLFALYALFHHPHTFRRYVIGSPAIWWARDEILRYESSFATSHSDLPVRVFMCNGALEEKQMTADMQDLARALQERGYNGLNLKTYIFEGETHVSVIPPLIGRGLRAVFE
jgi:predicted alpha/beta superfamily hydrolase